MVEEPTRNQHLLLNRACVPFTQNSIIGLTLFNKKNTRCASTKDLKYHNDLRG
jgi:hypothetical protein